MTILLSGGTGVLGSALRALLPRALAPSRHQMDLTDERSIRDYLAANTADVIIHAAALTSVRQCEADWDLARAVNEVGTRTLLQVSRQLVPESYFLYVSTAGVFSGREGGYDEASVPDPINRYGQSKLAGETRILGEKNVCIVRTNFARRGAWPYPSAFVDRFATCLYDTGAAKGVQEVLAARLTGVVHVCCDRRLSQFEFARLTDPAVLPMSLEEYVGPPLNRDLSLVTKRWRPYTLSD